MMHGQKTVLKTVSEENFSFLFTKISVRGCKRCFKIINESINDCDIEYLHEITFLTIHMHPIES